MDKGKDQQKNHQGHSALENAKHIGEFTAEHGLWHGAGHLFGNGHAGGFLGGLLHTGTLNGGEEKYLQERIARDLEKQGNPNFKGKLRK